MCAALIAAGYRIEQPIPVAVLALLAIGAERQSISLTPNAEVSVSSLVYVFAAVVLGHSRGRSSAQSASSLTFRAGTLPEPILRWGDLDFDQVSSSRRLLVLLLRRS